MKNNLEQAWKEEARKAYQDQQSQDNEGGCREPIAFVQGYLAAKKSDFEQIKTLKEQLAKAEQLIEEKMVIDDCGFDPSCETKFELENIMRINDCVARQYFAEKEKQDKEKREEK